MLSLFLPHKPLPILPLLFLSHILYHEIFFNHNIKYPNKVFFNYPISISNKFFSLCFIHANLLMPYIFKHIFYCRYFFIILYVIALIKRLLPQLFDQNYNQSVLFHCIFVLRLNLFYYNLIPPAFCQLFLVLYIQQFYK